MADGKVIISTALDNTGLKAGINGLPMALKKIGGLVAAAFSIRALVSFGKQAIELGSNVAEVQNVVDTAFGDMSYKIEDFSKTAIKNFGMSQLAAKKTASTYMAMARGMGMEENAASNMAIELTGLTGDVASFYNISQELADTKLKSVFTGETETLKELGVVMTQANLDAYAMANGFGKTTSAMNQAELVQLRYAYVTNALSLASGDFVKTQDSWANQTRILAMQWQEFMSIIGQALTQVLLPVVRTLNTIVASLIKMANAIVSVIGTIFGKASTQSNALAQQNDAIAGSAGAGADAEEQLAGSTKAAGKAAKNALGSFDELNMLQNETASGSGGTSSSAGGTSGASAPVTAELQVEDTVSPQLQAISDKIQELLEPFRAIDFEPLINAFARLKKAIEPLTQTLFAGLEWAYYSLFVPLAAWTIEDVLPAFLDILSGALRVLNGVLTALEPLGMWLWDSFLQPIAEWTGGIIVSALEGVASGLESISDWIDDNQKIVEVFAVIVGSFASAWGLVNGAIAIWNGIAGIATALTTAFGGAVTFLTSPVTLVILAIGALIAIVVLLVKNWDTVKAVAATCWDKIKAVWNAAATWFNDKVVSPIASFFGGLWEGIKGGASLLADWIRRYVIDPIVNAFKWMYNSVVGILEGIINGFIGIINGFIGGINMVIGTINKIPGVRLNVIGTLRSVAIPRLAQGAVIPPNREFMAVLGDQTSGTNIEAPASLIKQMVAEALSEAGVLGEQDITLNVTALLDGEVIYKNQEIVKSRRGRRVVGNPALL